MKFSPDRARISWVRAAYIVAFAAFGWRYTLQTSLNPVRAQFQNPSEITLPDLTLYESEADPSRRELFVVDEPVDCRSVVVRFGRRTIFLPAIDSVQPLDELATALRAYAPNGDNPEGYSMSGTFFRWPEKPRYALDVC
ncbi:hypothetical protein [Streptomyces sp. NPDC048277]|uniref:hypothetical protein n=1 Tax=Streptomyces sp. NPDC048277 TaxID=3155027 RepID=UPI0033CB2F39